MTTQQADEAIRLRPDFKLSSGRIVNHVAENGHQRALVTPGRGEFTNDEWDEYVVWKPWATPKEQVNV